VSPIVLGAMTYGEPDRGHPVWSRGEQEARPLIGHALEAGINFFDTANMYSIGSSEGILGRALNTGEPWSTECATPYGARSGTTAKGDRTRSRNAAVSIRDYAWPARVSRLR
jgi:aryl-alcohol dehydrogenase-like predicted oxidoreductase